MHTNWLAGVVIGIIIVANEASNAEVNNYLLNKYDFNNFFLLTYVADSSMSLFALVFWIKDMWSTNPRALLASSKAFNIQDSERLLGGNQAGSPCSNSAPLSFWQKAWRVSLIAWCNFTSTCLWYISLYYIPASVVSALYGSVSPMTYGIFVALGLERATRAKTISQLLLTAGLVIVGVSRVLQHNMEASSVWGVLIALLSSLAFALYELFFRRYEEDLVAKTPTQVLRLNGKMGVSILTLGAPVLAASTVFGSWTYPPVSVSVPFMAANAAWGVNFYVCYSIGMAVSSAPLLAAFTQLNLPATAIIDGMFRSEQFPMTEILGMAVVGLGLAWFNWLLWIEMREEEGQMQEVQDNGLQDIPQPQS